MVKILDDSGRERDFFFEMQKSSMHLRMEFTARQLAVYELYRKTIALPGSVAEFGVRNGANLFFLSRLVEIFNPGQRFDGISSRHVLGFDTFAGFPDVGEADLSEASWKDMRKGGVPTDREVFFEDFERFRRESGIGTRLHVFEGDVAETLPKLLAERPGLRFAFVYLDLDLYAPTLLVLQQVWDRIVPGGVVVFDEYAIPEFPGESRAVDEFLAGRGAALHAVPWAYCPSAYTIKGGREPGGDRIGAI